MLHQDIYHDTVKNALIQDGWTITHDPLLLPFGRRNLYVDLGAEMPIGASRNGEQIAVEIKSFVGLSEVTDLERALGQYMLYGFLLERSEPHRTFYLALPKDSYDSVFKESDAQDLITAQQLKLIVFEPTQEIIAQWIQ